MFCIALLGWNLTYIFSVTGCVCGIGREGGASFLKGVAAELHGDNRRQN